MAKNGTIKKRVATIRNAWNQMCGKQLFGSDNRGFRGTEACSGQAVEDGSNSCQNPRDRLGAEPSTTAPDTVKTQFDRAWDQEQVAQFLRDGCAQMRKAFDIEDVNLEDLIATALDDPQALG